MRKSQLSVAAAGAVALGCSAPAPAAVLDLEGHLSARAVVGADPSCAPLFRGVISPENTTGTSTLGDFTYSHVACTSGAAGGPVFGSFAITFERGGLEGTFAGTATPTSQPPVSTLDFVYTILGGTGRYLGATGSFTGIGTADPRVRPSRIELDFDGFVMAPAVPEPATWALLILGFGAIGGTMRRQPARLAVA